MPNGGRRDPAEHSLKQSDHEMDATRFALHSELSQATRADAYLVAMQRWLDSVRPAPEPR